MFGRGTLGAFTLYVTQRGGGQQKCDHQCLGIAKMREEEGGVKIAKNRVMYYVDDIKSFQ